MRFASVDQSTSYKFASPSSDCRRATAPTHREEVVSLDLVNAAVAEARRRIDNEQPLHEITSDRIEAVRKAEFILRDPLQHLILAAGAKRRLAGGHLKNDDAELKNKHEMREPSGQKIVSSLKQRI